jgi:DNA-binding IscR family transcriptional regulator
VTYKYYERCEECKDEETCGIRDTFLMVRNETVERLKAATLSHIIATEKYLKEEK